MGRRNTFGKTLDDPVNKVLQINKSLYSSPYCDDLMNKLSANLKNKSKSGIRFHKTYYKVGLL